MSEDTENVNNQLDNDVSAVPSTSKKLKKNFCYVCNIQCSGNTNFREHIKGRKHLKRTHESGELPPKKLKHKKNVEKNSNKLKKRSRSKTKESTRPETLNFTTCQHIEKSNNQSNNNNFQELLAPELMDHHSYPNFRKTNRQNMNFNRGFTNSRQNYFNHNPQNFSNSQHFNHRHFRSHDPDYWYNYFYEKPNPGYAHPHFNNAFKDRSKFPDCEIVENQPLFEQSAIVNNSSHVDPFSYNSNCLNERTTKYHSGNKSINDFPEKELYKLDCSSNSYDNILDTEKKQTANSLFEPVKRRNDLNDKDNSPAVSNSEDQGPSGLQQSFEMPSFVESENNESNVNQMPTKSVGNSTKEYEKEISSEVSNKSDNLNSASERQKIKDWTNTLLETHDGKLARLINPSNSKDKAALCHLITNLSKSKRKETLTKLKLQPSISELDTNDALVKPASNLDDINDQNISKESSQQDANSSATIISFSPVKKNKKSSKKLALDSALENNTKSKLQPNISKFDTNDAIVKQTSNLDDISDQNISKEPSEHDANSSAINISFSPVKKNKKSSKKLFWDSALENNTELSKKEKSKSKNKKRSSNELKEKSLKEPKKRKKKVINSEDQENYQAEYTQDFSSKCGNRVSHINESADQVMSSTPDSSQVPTTTVVPEHKRQEHSLDRNQLETSFTKSANSRSQIPNFEFSIENLIDLFASGDVKVKNEFNDPVIDAIKTVDPNELIQACNSAGNDGVSESTKETPNSAEQDLCTKESLVSEEVAEEKCVSPVVLGCLVDDTAILSPTPISEAPRTLSTETLINFDAINSSAISDAEKNENPFCYLENCVLPKDKSTYSPYLRELIEDLQKISSQEETVKDQLNEARCKINEYQLLLEEWKLKKKRLKTEEETLRVKRNKIIKLMENTVNKSDIITNKSKTSTNKEEIQILEDLPKSENLTNESKLTNSVVQDTEMESEIQNVSNATDHISHKDSDELFKETSIQNPNKENDEIEIIPIVKEVKQPEVIVIDDVPDKEDEKKEICSKTDSSLYNVKSLSAHKTVINNLVIFEDYLYTCSNDCTAKRFSIQDPAKVIIYFHAAKNVTDLAVEIVQNDVLVFTSCSNRAISLFIASTGTKLKTFFQSSPIMSICKGWGKFYAGLSNGSINVYNWKYEEKEIVKIDDGPCRIATAHQGRLHILIILSSNGHICLRDAETGLVIRFIKNCVKFPSWLSVYNDLAYFSSSDKTLTIMDIMTGRTEKKIYLSTQITGLTVYEDSIFTINYTGIVNCYSKDTVRDKKLYYGAGRNGLTCIHVYKDWVFTGNRKGEVSLFKFNPNSSHLCKVAKCNYQFGLKEDLEFHVEKDHLLIGKMIKYCNWSTCPIIFPSDWNYEERKSHVLNHLNE